MQDGRRAGAAEGRPACAGQTGPKPDRAGEDEVERADSERAVFELDSTRSH